MASNGYNLKGYATNDMTGKVVKILRRDQSNMAANTGYPMLVSGANYQVPAGKTFTITAISSALVAGLSTEGYVYLRYADDATLATNPVSLGCDFVPLVLTDLIPFYAVVPAEKYIGWFNVTLNTDLSVIVLGYES